jgi:hypothetical protein
VDGAQPGGGRHQHVTGTRRGEAARLGEQDTAQDRRAGRDIEGGRDSVALQQRGDDDGQGDDQPGVGGRCHGHAVGFAHQDSGQDRAEGHTGPHLGAADAAQAVAHQRGQHHCGDTETDRQESEYGVDRDGFLGGEVAGAPDGGHREQGGIDDAHGLSVAATVRFSQSNHC